MLQAGFSSDSLRDNGLSAGCVGGSRLRRDIGGRRADGPPQVPIFSGFGVSLSWRFLGFSGEILKRSVGRRR
jgi:hypothetical protein